MKVYDIESEYCYSAQIHSVVAENMAEAERIFLGKYWPRKIKSIQLHSEYVQIQKYDEQFKNETDELSAENK